jgi:putative colanic acid biosynthesis acetyltransferase WcaF
MPRDIHYNAAEHISAATAEDPYLRPAFSLRNRVGRVLWGICWSIFYRLSPRPFHAWRSMLLRLFGATLGPNCHFYPTSRIWAPWNLVCADQVTAGDGAEIYNPAPIRLGSHAILSQNSYLCGATHDFDDPAFPLLAYTMEIGPYAWRRRSPRPRLSSHPQSGTMGYLRRLSRNKSKRAPTHPLSVDALKISSSCQE